MKMKPSKVQFCTKELLFRTVGKLEGYGPGENETTKSLKKAAERNEIRLL